MTHQLDIDVKIIFAAIVAHSPEPGPTPNGDVRSLTTANTSRRHRVWLTVAAASIVAVGVAAVASLSSPPAMDPPSVDSAMPQYTFTRYTQNGQGSRRLEFHFKGGRVDAVPISEIRDLTDASAGEVSYTQQDPANGLLICGEQHFGEAFSIDLFLPAGWFPNEPVGNRTDLGELQNVDELVADGAFGKVVGCSPRNDLIQIAIFLGGASTADRVRVEAVGQVVTITISA